MSSTTSVLSTNKASSSGRADQKLRRFQLQKCIFFFNFYSFYGSRDSLLVRVPDSWSKKVASSNPGRSGGWIVFSRVNFVCWLLLGVRSTHVLPQWHVIDRGHSAKSAGGRLHLNTHIPLTQRSRSGLTMLLYRHSVGTYKESSSHTTHQGTLSHSHLSSLRHCVLILA